ncbi:hypothetical protein RHS01_07632 [Rhizoctonia solani]|uniref:Uncharacterized protein n=1 Tax=Rhizoctonia solani TaxID=456999 RepID=A0A8H7I7A0_9AGAM|nr:hypothetical protein RHS01_07632 [Rhizoctonia solani]
MRNFFALVTGFVLLMPAIIASPVSSTGGKGPGDGKCVAESQPCGGSFGFCCGGHECRSGGHGSSRSFNFDYCFKIPAGGVGKPGYHSHPEYPGHPSYPNKPNKPEYPEHPEHPGHPGNPSYPSHPEYPSYPGDSKTSKN